MEDGTYGVIDFKTSSAEKTASIYGRQLHAYAAALENPSAGSELERCTVSDLGLIVYTPAEFHTPIDDERQISAALTGQLRYSKVRKDNEQFENFLSSMLDVLTLEQAPDPPRPKTSRSKMYSTCPYCQFLHEARLRGFIHTPDKLPAHGEA